MFMFVLSLEPGESQAGATFQEASGIEHRVPTGEVPEEAGNAYRRRLPASLGHGNLQLARGYVIKGSALADWADGSVTASLGTPITPRTLYLSLVGPFSEPLIQWAFVDAWPVKWVTTAGADTSQEILIETLEIAYAAMTRTESMPG